VRRGPGEQPAEFIDPTFQPPFDEPHDGRLVDVAIRAALGTGAGVRVIPKHGPVNEGIGGLLRWR
jgi:hypothetical protein